MINRSFTTQIFCQSHRHWDYDFRIMSLLLSLSLTLGFFSLAPLAPVVAQFQLPSLTNQNQTDTTSRAELDLSLSPPVTYLSLKPGETKSLQLTLKNSGTRSLRVQLELAEFTSDGKTGRPVLKLQSTFPYLKAHEVGWSWGQSRLLKSGETAVIDFDLKLPETIILTEKHFTILARASQISDVNLTNLSSNQQLGGSSQVAGLIGSNLIVAIAADDTNLSKVKLTDWSIPKLVDSLRGISVTGLVKNFGAHSGPILGQATLTNSSGQLLKAWLFYPDMVLPESTREIRVIDVTSDPTADPQTWLNRPNPLLTNQLKYQPSWLFGTYTLKVRLYHLDYTEAQPVSAQTFYLTALPFSIMIGLLILPMSYWLILKTRELTTRVIKAKLPTTS